MLQVKHLAGMTFFADSRHHRHTRIIPLSITLADALEKLRHSQVAGEASGDTETPLQIRITTDEATNTITM